MSRSGHNVLQQTHILISCLNFFFWASTNVNSTLSLKKGKLAVTQGASFPHEIKVQCVFKILVSKFLPLRVATNITIDFRNKKVLFSRWYWSTNHLDFFHFFQNSRVLHTNYWLVSVSYFRTRNYNVEGYIISRSAFKFKHSGVPNGGRGG